MTRIREDIRYYGCWAGNQKGFPEDPHRCIEGVWSKDQWSRESQCSFKRGHGKDGLYCKIHAKLHDPVLKAAKDKAFNDKYEANLESMRLGWDGRAYLNALVEIAKGHNDPRALARQVLLAKQRDPETGAKCEKPKDED